ncbi:efflux RND transporter periplasmic adaptor subunit [Jeongeupia naejangsanensis]|uniref:Efflux RND transporter periplasmic adaptor subunit n=1 Tax=Jeongeupia naejangsanensis TaxID=613195 RepID=A0ABS2BIP6_9NEIS|nr:efflux RND transporter periplasmic adaptor subunit [Jeongeupia naejangsanensis]MBM3115481.1 efflux RND transporter periplasmic adaptor subunit [Jeongeupia naejangsanensis]
MNTKTTIAIAIATLGIGAFGGWLAGQRSAEHGALPGSAAKAEKPVLYWYDPMKPDVHFDKPGKSPFMDMQLQPRYADEGGEAAGVRIDSALAQNTGVKLAKVERGELAGGLSVSGTVVFNDRDVAIVQARTGGIVERAYPHAVGDVIAAGSPLADVRVPEWLTAQNEYLALRGDAQLAAAAKSRLIQLGMSAAAVAQLERSGVARPVVTITAPRGGMIAELGVRQGMTLTAGQALARINGLSSVWIEADVPEAQAATLRVGAPVQAHFAAWPDQPVNGKVTALVPELKAETRTIRARIEVPNRDGRLLPGQYARVTLAGEAKPALWVPSDAVIATGLRHVVIAVDGDAKTGWHYAPVEVRIGREAGGRSEIIAGLDEGRQVVVSGQFMIDSEASLRGVLARMASAPAAAQPDARVEATASPEGVGVVRVIEAGSVTLAHEPIAALKWPAMTMPFTLMNPVAAKGLKVGDKVRFTLMMHGDDAMIESMIRIDGGGQ